MIGIFEAISEGDLERIREIVRADPSILNTAIGEYGESPLMASISDMERRLEIIEFLVESGANVGFATKEGYTALHCNIDLNGPSGSGRLPDQVARLLKDKGANVEARNHYGWTPLMRAAIEGTGDEFKALLDIGADFGVRYPAHAMPAFTRGRSLASIVLPQPEKVRMLLAAGFKPEPSLIDDAKQSLEEAKDPDSSYGKGLRESMEIIQGALGAA